MAPGLPERLRHGSLPTVCLRRLRALPNRSNGLYAVCYSLAAVRLKSGLFIDRPSL